MIKKGDTFGCWKVIDSNPERTPKQTLYTCKCIHCKDVSKVRQTYLLNHTIGKCRKCFTQEVKYKGFTAAQKFYFCAVKSKAKFRKIPFNISPEFVFKLLEKQKHTCALTGLEINITGKNNTASIDRKDSAKGYIKNNVQWLHKTINQLKSSMPEDKFIDWCKRVAEFNKKKIKNESI